MGYSFLLEKQLSVVIVLLVVILLVVIVVSVVILVVVLIVVSVVIVVHEIYLLINGAKCSLNNCGRRFFISGF